MICCGFKGIHRNARKAVEASICGMTLLPDVYSNNKFTKILYLHCCLGECKKCCYQKEKMWLIEKNVKLLASNISCSWSRWVRPNNVETNSKKNANSKEEEKNKDEERKNVNGKKQKEKKKFKVLMIEEKTGTAIDLLNVYIEDIQVMRKHNFYNVWQTYQFMLNKANLQPNQIILVQDFARNFILDFQDKPKDFHWDHNQVTVHPTVIYRYCLTEGCDELVTEEIIHIMLDLKHNPLTITNFEEDIKFHRRSKNISYEEKFIWMDQAPTQYKSCCVFEGIDNSSTCITHHYYPVHHGKNPADGSSGHLKRKFIRYKKLRGKAIRVAQELFKVPLRIEHRRTRRGQMFTLLDKD